MVHSWATGRAVVEASKDVKMSKKMEINIYQWYRDICSWKLINGPPLLLGGPGAIVQIDESVFTYQGKVYSVFMHLYTTFTSYIKGCRCGITWISAHLAVV